MSHHYRFLIRGFVVFVALVVGPTVMAGMPQFPTKPLPRRTSPAQCNIQPATSTSSEPKSNPYSDLSDPHRAVVAMILCASGSKRTNPRACSDHHATKNLRCLAAFIPGRLHFLQVFPTDSSASRLDVILRC